VKTPAPHWIFLALLASCFSLATSLQPRANLWSRGDEPQNILQVLFGDGRRIFANHFFVKADISFHSGFYPSIFDQAQRATNSSHMTAQEGSKEEEEHEQEMSFLGKPHDWIERFGRHFFLTQHTHLSGGNEREMLPWLRLSASLNPQRTDTYTVASYWLRSRLGKPEEAEQFLREGLRANPNSYEILFELGCLYRENFNDPKRAEGVLRLALQRWREQELGKKDPNNTMLDKIIVRLAKVEQDQGKIEEAIRYLEEAKPVSPYASDLQARIDELRALKRSNMKAFTP
jgi:tetratricopeptide (TPR) repeat protein